MLRRSVILVVLAAARAQTNLFRVNTSIVVVRLGNATYSALNAPVGVALPVFLDEFDASGDAPPVALHSVAVPPSSCTLATGKSLTQSATTAYQVCELGCRRRE